MNRLSYQVALAILTAALMGCGTGGAGDSGTDGGTGSGTDGGTGPGTTTITWAGTWNITVNYGVTCDIGFGNTKSATYSSTFTTALTGANSSLTATTDVNYYMSGTGSDSNLLLNGTFPLKGADNQKASTGEDRTDLSIRLETVANANSASGTITGTFRSGFGASCEVQPGATVTFTRGTGSGTGSGSTITWAGTWIVAVNYGVTCDIGFGNTKSATYSSTFTTALTGANSSLTATTDVNYYMSGTGSDSNLLLNGTFPLKGADNQKASTGEDGTDLSIRLETVANANSASGIITGTFRSGFGASCEVQPGATVTFTRS